MSNVKVMVGSNYKSENGNIFSLSGIRDDKAHFSNGMYCDLDEVNEIFTFVPANDLEWLSVNCDNFYSNESANVDVNDGYVGLIHDASGKYSHKQWLDTRIKLGLEMNIDDIAKEEVKPVYTQAMCDAGEQPKLGMMVSCYSNHLLPAPVSTGPVKYIGKDVVVILDENCNNEISFYIDMSTFEPIKTEEEKLIDEMMHYSYQSVDEYGHANLRIACEELFEAGYRKESK